MVELFARILLVAAAALATHTASPANLSPVFKLGAFAASYSVLLYLLERKGWRTAQISTLVGCVDALAICALLGFSAQLSTFGFLALIPVASASSRFGALPATMAPIAAGGLVASHLLFTNSETIELPLVAQAIAVLSLGLLLNDRKIIMTVAKPVLPRHSDPSTDDPGESLELRESFRKLREMYHDLDSQSKRTKGSLKLATLEPTGKEDYYAELAALLRDLSGASTILLHLRSDIDGKFAPRAWSGPITAALKLQSLELHVEETPKALELEAHGEIAALLKSSNVVHSSILLRNEGKLFGLVTVFGPSSESLDVARDRLSEQAELMSRALSTQRRQQVNSLRLKEAELSYGLAVVLDGATAPKAAAARGLTEVFPSLGIDHLSLTWLSGDTSTPSITEGRDLDFVEGLSFAKGKGLAGWKAIGAPEVVMPDVYEDSRCPSVLATKARVGSFAIIPIAFGDEPLGVICMASQRTGGIGIDSLDAIRRLAGELGQALNRIETSGGVTAGIASPSEMQEEVASCSRGCLVYLEPYRKKQLIDQVGLPQFEAAINQLSKQIRGRLPAGSLLTRRQEGDFVVLLRNISESRAVSWANETAAMASFIGVRIPRTDHRIPLALRAKIAQIGKQKDLISQESPS